jgi:spore coat protein U-like protein
LFPASKPFWQIVETDFRKENAAISYNLFADISINTFWGIKGPNQIVQIAR